MYPIGFTTALIKLITTLWRLVDKCGQLFIRTHNETLSVAVCINNPDRSHSESMAETQSKLQPACSCELVRWVSIW